MAWVEYTGTFEDAIKISKTNGAPFKTVRGPKDTYEWQDDGNLLKLFENTWTDSGALHLRVADGWRVAFRIATENTDYFNDNIRDEYVSGDSDDNFLGGGSHSEETSPTGEHDEVDEVWVYEDDGSGDYLGSSWVNESQSNVLFTLWGNDYLSVDVDGDHDSIANFSLNKGTVAYDVSTDREMSDDTFVRMVKAWMWVDDLPATDETQSHNDGETEQEYGGSFNENEEVNDDDIAGGGGTSGTTDTTTTGEDKPEIEIDETKPEDKGDTVLTCEEGWHWDTTLKMCVVDEEESSDDEDDYSIFIVLAGIIAVIVGSIYILRGGKGEQD